MSRPDNGTEFRTVSVSNKGQATIPKDIREAVGIEPGSEVAVYVEDGRVIVEPFPSTPEELHGIHAGEREGPSILEKSREWDEEDREREAGEMGRLREQIDATDDEGEGADSRDGDEDDV